MQSHEVIKTLGISKKALNYYEEKGLINVDKDENGYRCFNQHHIEQLHIIKTLRLLSFSISDIQRILFEDEMEQVFNEHYNTIDKQIMDLEIAKEHLVSMKAILSSRKYEGLSQLENDIQQELQINQDIKTSAKSNKNNKYTSDAFLFMFLAYMFAKNENYPFIREYGSSLCFGIAIILIALSYQINFKLTYLELRKFLKK